MSLNTAHANNGVLIHAGERYSFDDFHKISPRLWKFPHFNNLSPPPALQLRCSILLFSDNVTMDFNNQNQPEFKGQKTGRMYLTTHRMIFNNKKATDPMLSFSAPFVALSSVEVEQPVFGANCIKGLVTAQEHGGFNGRAGFKMVFKSGGAIDFAQAMLRAVQMARRNYQFDAPPPYMPPNGQLYPAPPPAYTPSPQGYYGWHPATQAFPSQPPPNSVYMHDSPPPYPGIGGQAPPMQQPAYSGGGGGGWMPQQQPAQNPGYPMGQGGYNPGGQPQYPPPQQQGYNPAYNPGYSHPQAGGAAMGFNPGFNPGGPGTSANSTYRIV